MNTNTASGGHDIHQDERSDQKMSEDSGNFSCTSNISTGNDVPMANALRERDQALFLAMQDLRKLRSELERLSKSEQWYKLELKSQKTTRLETLERLYTQERKYMKENQRLQEECLRLFTKCTELERQLENQQIKEQQSSQNGHQGNNDAKSENEIEFELKHQQSFISDQARLIDVLRNQKKELLSDIQRLDLDHNEKLMELQKIMANLELENNLVTGKCKKLLDDKIELEEKLRLKDTSFQSLSTERGNLQKVTSDLNEMLLAQEKLLALKEQQFLDLKTQFTKNLATECNADKVHWLSLDYHTKINAKTNEITALKTSLKQLQDELIGMSELEAKNELNERTIEQLTFVLETQSFEYENLKATDNAKTQQLSELSVCLENLRKEKDAALKNVRELQEKHNTEENELINLHKQYADACAISESLKFQLELQEIEAHKHKCQTDCDGKEIQRLRQCLEESLLKIEGLSQRIEELENELETRNEKIEFYSQLVENKNAKLERLEEYRNLEEENIMEKTELTMCQTKESDDEGDEEETEREEGTILELIKSTDNLITMAKSIKVQNTRDAETTSDIELQQLRKQVQDLEEKVHRIDTEKKKTLSLLQSVLSSQNDKVKQINASCEDWQDLLKAIGAMQCIEQEMREQLQHKNAELEELNLLFAEQNEELHNLQELAYISEQSRDKDFSQMKQTFHKEIETLQERRGEDNTYQEQIFELQCKLENLLEERESTLVKVQTLENELKVFKRNFFENTADSSGQNTINTDDYAIRMVCKILENESGRKLHRNDMPSLVKNLKKIVRAAKLAKINRKSEDLLRSRLEDLHLKYEASQNRIKSLEQSLELERHKFEASDLGKSAYYEEPAHEVANLIDDYKKLIQQSAQATGRARTNAILDLIERSNRCMPTLAPLEGTVNDLRLDVQQLTNILTTIEANNCCIKNVYMHDNDDFDDGDDIPSLMDELRAAVANNL